MSSPRLTSLAEHPRAAGSIRRSRAWGGVLGFALGAAASQPSGAPLADVLAAALVGGVVAHLVVWAAAVAVWKRLLVAEARSAAVRLHRAAAAADETG